MTAIELTYLPDRQQALENMTSARIHRPLRRW